MTGLLDRLVVIDATELRRRVPMRVAIRAVQAVLESGFDPARDPIRTIVDVEHGELLLMPSDLGRYVGQKLATVAPGNPARGLERIQGVYLLLDGETLTPMAILDGTELTSIRTPAVSAAGVDLLAPADARSLVVFGTGPQGIRHGAGLDAAVGSVDDVRDADLVVCATTARSPLFEADLVADHAVVVAVGSHEPDARELDAALIARSQVVVETPEVALREAGDVVLAIEEGAFDPGSLVSLAEVVTRRAPVDVGRPRVLKTSGMGWEDLAVATAVLDHGTAAD